MPANSARFGQGVFGQCVFGRIYENLTATLDTSSSFLVPSKDVGLSATLNSSHSRLVDKPVLMSAILNLSHGSLVDVLLNLFATLDLSHARVLDKPVSLSATLNPSHSYLLDKAFNLLAALNLSHSPLIDKLVVFSAILGPSHVMVVDKPIVLSATLNPSHGVAMGKNLVLSNTLNPSTSRLIDKIMLLSNTLDLSHGKIIDKLLVFSNTLNMTHLCYKLFGAIEILGENWAWLDTYVVPSSTPISGSSPGAQVPYALVIHLEDNWAWYFILTPVLDLILSEASVLEQSIVADLPVGAEEASVQYLGSRDDFLLLRLTGSFDMIRQLDGLNRNDEVTVRIRSNGVTWWQGYVRFLSHGGQPVPAGVNLVMMDIPARGKAETETRTMIGMMGDAPTQAKYMLILTKDHGWVWTNPLVETSEEI